MKADAAYSICFCLFSGQVDLSAKNAHGRDGLGQLKIKLHLGRPGFLQRLAFEGLHIRYGEGEGAHIRSHSFQSIALGELVSQTA